MDFRHFSRRNQQFFLNGNRYNTQGLHPQFRHSTGRCTIYEEESPRIDLGFCNYPNTPSWCNKCYPYPRCCWFEEYHPRHNQLRQHKSHYTAPRYCRNSKTTKEDNVFEARRHLVRRRDVQTDHHSFRNTRENTDGWRIVKYTKRRHNARPDQCSTAHQRPKAPNPEILRASGNFNRHQRLELEDKYNSLSPLTNEPDLLAINDLVGISDFPTVDDSQAVDRGHNRGTPAASSSARRTAIAPKHTADSLGADPLSGSSASSAFQSSGNGVMKPRRQEDSKPASPSHSVPEIAVSAVVGSPTIRPGHGNSCGNIPKELSFTWADVLKSNKKIKPSVTPGTNSAESSSATNSNPLNNDMPATCSVTKFNRTEDIRVESALGEPGCENFMFFGQEGFDSIKIESKVFKFAVKNGEVVIFEVKKSQLHKIQFKIDLVPQIIRFMSQLTSSASKLARSKRFGDITVSLETNRSGDYVKLAKNHGSSAQIPVGPKKSSLFKFINIFSNFAGPPESVQDDSISLQYRSTYEIEDNTSISKLILNYQIQAASIENQLVFTPMKQLPRIEAYSDASDGFDHSDDSFFRDDFLGHATESDRRLPISYPEEIRNSKLNRAICRKAKFVTSENCLPTDNLNTQLKIYRKTQKNKRRHSMTTRSQSRDFPWD
ncbi:unnamed protein product [Cuscuta epithymum]|uniref:Uncharacterized protein n=3 Tax=Cuscuta epithymum TaxID=186058 RepID=A0AAV0FU37_9ASTE|nr:unnamed protein product [Cuscuta epithymum]